jgi:multidrug efflux pump subunit AcrA (membrane-fusion protein)
VIDVILTCLAAATSTNTLEQELALIVAGRGGLPSLAQVQEAAVAALALTDAEEVEAWSSRARLRGLAPTVDARFGTTTDLDVRGEVDGEGWTRVGRGLGLDVSTRFNLGDLVFSDQELRAVESVWPGPPRSASLGSGRPGSTFRGSPFARGASATKRRSSIGGRSPRWAAPGGDGRAPGWPSGEEVMNRRSLSGFLVLATSCFGLPEAPPPSVSEVPPPVEVPPPLDVVPAGPPQWWVRAPAPGRTAPTNLRWLYAEAQPTPIGDPVALRLIGEGGAIEARWFDGRGGKSWRRFNRRPDRAEASVPTPPINSAVKGRCSICPS